MKAKILVLTQGEPLKGEQEHIVDVYLVKVADEWLSEEEIVNLREENQRLRDEVERLREAYVTIDMGIDNAIDIKHDHVPCEEIATKVYGFIEKARWEAFKIIEP